jgi:hypothetical protein
LVYSTYLGGSDDDYIRAVSVDASQNVFVAGSTSWPSPDTGIVGDFPVVNALQPSFGGGYDDAFVAKLDASGSAWVYATYLGGGWNDYASAVAADSDGNAYVTGGTYSVDFPLLKPIQSSGRIFVVKLNTDGNTPLFSTRIGGTKGEWPRQMALDSQSNLCIVGQTYSPDFPVVRPIQREFVGKGICGIGGICTDGFILRLHADGGKMLYSTYLGGSKEDDFKGLVLDLRDNAYLVGETRSKDLPVVEGGSPDLEGFYPDVYLAKIGGSQLYISQFADGTQDGSSISSTITLLNLSTTTTNAAVTISSNSGGPLTSDFNGVEVEGTFETQIAGNGVVNLKTDGEGPLQTGSAFVDADSLVTGYVLYETPFGVAGLQHSEPVSQVHIPIEVRPGVNSGVALLVLEESQTFELELRNAEGNTVARDSFWLPNGHHIAKFVTEFNWDVPVDFSDFEGVLYMRADLPFAAAALRLSPNGWASLPLGN